MARNLWSSSGRKNLWLVFGQAMGQKIIYFNAGTANRRTGCRTDGTIKARENMVW